MGRDAARQVTAGLAILGLIALSIWLRDAPNWGRGAAIALVVGVVLGVAMQRSQFCFAAAWRDLFLLRERRMALGVLAALAAGSIGTWVIFGAWVPDPSAGFLPPRAHIAPVGWHLLLGGGTFGVGMVLAGGCLSGQLFRLGEGSLVAPVALLASGVGFWGGYAVWNPIYSATVASSPVVWLPQSFGYAGALAMQLLVLGACAALLLARFSGRPPRQAATTSDLTGAWRRATRERWPAWIGGVVIGLLGAAATLRASPLGVTAELQRMSRRVGESLGLGLVPARLDGLDTLAGCRAVPVERWLGDNGLLVAGLVAGSFCAALAAGEFRLRSAKPRTYLLAVLGGVLLGFGAMISLGCTIGTLFSGITAFAVSGWVFALGLGFGAWIGSRILRRLAV